MGKITINSQKARENMNKLRREKNGTESVFLLDRSITALLYKIRARENMYKLT